MKVWIEIPIDQYDQLRQACDEHSDEFRILMAACVVKRRTDGKSQRIVEILCDTEDVKKIFELAKRLSPDVAKALVLL